MSVTLHKMQSACLVVILAAGWGWAQTSEVPFRPSIGRLKVVEEKAEQADDLARQNNDLQQKVTNLQQNLTVTQGQLQDYRVKTSESRIQDLEKKAIEFAALQNTLRKRDDQINDLRLQIDDLNAQIAALQTQVDSLQLETGQMRFERNDMETALKSLQKTLEQFWLGHFEYYTVQDGDTLKSIAAMPQFYGDGNKAIWIEQANFNHVKDVNRLRPGEVLIIPRFPPSGRYEF